MKTSALLVFAGLGVVAGCGARAVEVYQAASAGDAGQAGVDASGALDAQAAGDTAFDWDTGVADPRVASSGSFPYVYDDDEHAPPWARFRAEGLTADEVTVRILDYMKKYNEKRRTAPSAEVAYFERQRALAAALRAAGTVPPGAAAAHLGLAGDIMWISDGWDTFLDERLRARMAQEDLWLGNLETPVAQSVEVGAGVAGLPVFNSAPGLVHSFRRDDGTSLFEVLSFANNHTLDHGDGAARETLDFLSGEGIAAAGVRAAPGPSHVVFEVRGVRFGVCAATWGMNDMASLGGTALDIDWVRGLAPAGVKPVDLAATREVLGRMAADAVDLKIVLLHWGHEYEMYPNPIQMAVARELVWAGADIIVGAHSHVPQPAEMCFVNGAEAPYAAARPDLAALTASAGCVLAGAPGPPRTALVLYSLGNFATAMNTDLCRAGAYYSLDVFRAADGAVGWAVPAHGFVYNAPAAPPDGTRRTLRLADYLAANCFSDACPSATLDEIGYLRAHLGSDLGLEEE